MTDRDLLELAARAAGYKICARGSESVALVLSERKPDGTRLWNPLDDDGDVFRLAVKLRLEIDMCKTGIAIRTWIGIKILVNFSEYPDQYTATRRAIVRAAAELGKQIGR